MSVSRICPLIRNITKSCSVSPALLAKRTLCQTRALFAEKRFSEKHEWVTKDGSAATVGISEYAQESLGDVVYVQLPDIGAEFSAHEEVGAVESVKAASEIYTPLSGKITEVNTALEDKPGLVNTSCYDEGWLFKIQIKDEKEYDKLMTQEAYDKFLKTVKQ